MQADIGQVHTTNLRGAGTASVVTGDFTETAVDYKPLFKHFVENFRLDGEFYYRSLLRDNLNAGVYFLEVSMEHLGAISEKLTLALQVTPSLALTQFEAAAVEVAEGRRLFPRGTRHDIQVQVFWKTAAVPIRAMPKQGVAKLVCVSGIVVKTGPTAPRCVRATIMCTSCRSKTTVAAGKSIDLPAQCHANTGNTNAAGGGGNRQSKCRPNPYVVLPDQCEFEDSQVVKFQELPEDVPTGELPRHITCIMDRCLVNKVSPGSRVQVVGITSVHDRRGSEGSKALSSTRVVGLRAQYLRCVGLMNVLSTTGTTAAVESVNKNFSSTISVRSRSTWQPGDENKFKEFSQQPTLYEDISQGIDPAVFGLEDHKKAIAALLFGGTRKAVDGNNLRGDVNVLLIGDPSTAKSQLLKFTEKVAPIGIYTSGKGSSAAGLTASVVNTGKGDFWLEAGSMVLADGGVVCIDEFDKMREQDQVAIHEAMEQQTISIAKANLTTMLNSRTSVLAAANPTLGNYDALKSNEDQMEFQGSILSRFDLIFKVLDHKNVETDTRLANHVISLHKGKARGALQQQQQGKLSLSFLSRYIAYARATCHPRISDDAKNRLLDFFVQVRRQAHEISVATASASSKGASVIQITARQLESLVRITEAMAKMRLDPIATSADAEEAIRLFKASTVDAITSGVVENNLTPAQRDLVQDIEERVRRHVALGDVVKRSALSKNLERMGFDSSLVRWALHFMIRREELEVCNSQSTHVKRKK